MIFGDFMMGARSRLLPPKVPFQFFGAAVILHPAAWILLAIFAGDVGGFLGGPGEILAALHVITLGVALMTAMGAAYQILPVVTKKPLRSVAACHVSFWLYLPGVMLLTHGMGHQEDWAMEGGGLLTVAGITLFALLIADNLRHVKDIPVVTDHLWAAVGCLAVLAGLGLALVFDLRLGFFADHAGAAMAHAVIAAYGFMGMLAFGFSFLLIPLFGLSPPPDSRLGRLAARVMIVGLIAAAIGLAADQFWLLSVGGAFGGTGVVMHLRVMAKVMKGRMRKALGDSFLLIRMGWALLPVSMVVGLMAAAGFAVDRTGPLFGFILVFGWLLSFLLGILQRIMPFLASMHSVRPGLKPVLVSALTADRPLRVHMVCHFSAVALIVIGIIGGQTPVIRLGALCGLIGAVAFLIASARLGRTLWAHLNSLPQDSETK